MTHKLEDYLRATNYLSAAQIYLQDNVLLKKPLRPEHIKPRLLGHWGTAPGINLVYAHLNRLIIAHDLDLFLITGPGHGAVANLANLYLERTLEEYFPDLTLDEAGLTRFVRRFSWPGGFPSHLYPGIPGTIHEGGELGYALATAFGAVMDNPELIVACIVGDGEAETGPTATAWHSHKFIDPAESGAVLPIVHINGYKISSPTLFGTMSEKELSDYFSGLGYLPLHVTLEEIQSKMAQAMEISYHTIRSIQEAARSYRRINQPRWPVILLHTPKGWTGIKQLGGEDIEGNCLSHQVPAKDCKSNLDSLKAIENWLRSYHPEELFDSKGTPLPGITAQCPKGSHRMGMNPHTLGLKSKPLLVDKSLQDYSLPLDLTQGRGRTMASSVRSCSRYLSDLIEQNPHSFRLFSPDELESNQVRVWEVTQRNFQWPLQEHDRHIGPSGGRVLEILSEHTCQGWMQGYVLTGRYALFPSYEAFLGIVTTMMDQYAKFIKMAREIPWRSPVPSLNYLATSTHWRQEHNGFSHQNPGFVNTLLNKKGQTVRVYLPPDANCALSTLDHCLQSHNYVNLIISGKQELPQWLTMPEAIAHCRAGASIWHWASSHEGIDPDVVLVGIGDDVTLEVIAAADILRKELPMLRIRVINVTDLLVLEEGSNHPHGMDAQLFFSLFTPEKPVIFNFHGYPSAIKQLLFHRGDTARYQINGYIEEGTTTTPFDMVIRNKVSRFHIAIQAIRLAAPHNEGVAALMNEKISAFEYRLQDHREFIMQHGKDPYDIAQWIWEG